MKIFNKLTVVIILSVFLLIYFFVSTTAFLEKNDEIVFNQQKEQLINTAENNVNSLNLFLLEYVHILETGTNIIRIIDKDFDTNQVYGLLNGIKEAGKFLSVSINTQKGISYLYNKSTTTLHPNYLELMKSKDIIISDIIYDKYLKKNVISISVPIFTETEGKYIYLNADLSLDNLSNVLNESFVDDSIVFYLIDSNMICIANSDNDISPLKNMDFKDAVNEFNFTATSVAEVLSSFESKQSKFCSYSYGSADKDADVRYLYYLPVGINNWMYGLLVPGSVIDNGASLHSKNTWIYLLKVVFILLVVFVIIILWMLQISNDDKIKQKAITVFAKQTKKIIFEWNWKKDHLKKFTEYSSSILGKKDVLFDYNIFKIIHPDDIDVMQSAFDNILKGEDTTGLVVRLQQINNDYVWFSFSSATVKSKKGRLLNVYGFLENINATFKHTEELQQNIKKDPLTRLYNKVATEELVTGLLTNKNEIKSALFFIDFDNFKLINDTFGHLKGDEVLKAVSSGLQSIFSQTDIVGRIGGDEFIVFLDNYESISFVRSKAQLLCDSLRKTYHQDGVSIDVTFSIGIALAPEQGTDFKTLVSAADKALYIVKENGKNGYKIFS